MSAEYDSKEDEKKMTIEDSKSPTSKGVQEEEKQDILLEAAELRFSFTLLRQEKRLNEADNVLKKLIKIMDENNMIEFYKEMCLDNSMRPDQSLIDKWTQNEKNLLSKNDEEKKIAESSEGDTEVHEIELNRCKILSKTSTMENAINSYLKVKNLTTGKKIDKYLTMLRICLVWQNDHAYIEHADEATKLIEKGGDWDRRNRFTVYNGVHNFRVRNFKKAAKCFLDSIATFSANEIFDYKRLVEYTIISSVLSLERVDIKTKLIDSPEIIQIISEIPLFKSFLYSFYECRYNEFFRSLIEIMKTFIRRDFYLHSHANFFLRETRIRAYSQYLKSYRSVKLNSMAKEFGVNEEFIDTELSSFISCNKIMCKIDKVNGVVEMNRDDQRNVHYQDIIKKGDALLNRIQRLSRIITC